MTSAPLAGLRVLDFGHHIAGPLAGVFLADQGADVLRVVRPGAEPADAATDRILARGKRTLELDLKDPEGVARVLGLAAECDVVLENFRPGVMDRLGLGYETVRRINSSVVYVSMPGYSRFDPRAAQPGWDAPIAAESGLFTDLSIAGAGLGLPPTYTPLPLASVYAGLWGAIAAAAAIYARNRSGRGDWIEAPLADAAMSAAAGVVFGLEGQPARYNAPPISRRILDRISLTRVPRPVARRVHRATDSLMPPFFRNYGCADGELLFLCAIDNANQIGKLLDALGLRDAARKLGLRDGDVLDVPSTTDNLNAYRGTSRRWKRLERLIAARLKSAPAEYWEDRLARAGVPAARQRETSNWTAMSSMRDSAVVVVPADGGAVQPAPQVDVRGRGAMTKLRAATRTGHGWSGPATFAAPPPRDEGRHGAPLSGVHVLDLANVIAGPAAGRTLAELGAEVTHISPVAPRMGPRMSLLLGLEVNQGKSSAAVDLRSSAGRDVLGRLLPGADVVLYNKLPDQARRLGVAPDQVHEVNHRAVVTAVTAYGGVLPGGWEDRPAYDPVIQALTGVMRRFGGDDAPAVHGIASCIDYFTGFAAAYATIVGLLARDRGATHLAARTSLVRTAGWVQLPFLDDDQAPRGLDARGPAWHNGLHRTRDGWVHVVIPENRHDAASRAVGATTGNTSRKVATALRRRRSEEVRTWALTHGGTAARVATARELRARAEGGQRPGSVVDPASPSGRVARVTHPAGERMWLTEPTWIRPLLADRRRLSPAPAPGEHTEEVLAWLGYSADERQDILRGGAASAGWQTGETYVPR